MSRATMDRRLLVIFGRHAYRSCRLRSHDPAPCRRCCLCIGDCHHPDFLGDDIEEVAV